MAVAKISISAMPLANGQPAGGEIKPGINGEISRWQQKQSAIIRQ